MTGLRFRVFVGDRDAELLPMVAEDWVGRPGDDDGSDVAKRHGAICHAAMRRGQRWRLEVHDPDEPEETGCLWFGSDTMGMVMPIQLHLIDGPSPN